MRLSRPGRLHRLLGHYMCQPLSYPEQGATAGVLPAGYEHVRRRTRLGEGDISFLLASRALMTWAMHRGAGLAVATDGPAQPNRTVVLGVGVGAVLVVPCRVVYVVDAPDRRGFAYGTLPDHPEQGEEAFTITHDNNGGVWLEIVAFSRPGSALVRWTSPVARAVQAAMTKRYERSLATWVN